MTPASPEECFAYGDRDRSYISTLQRRCRYRLEERGRVNDWDRAERSALPWVLAELASVGTS